MKLFCAVAQKKMTDQLISRLLLEIQTVKQDVAQVKSQLERVLAEHRQITTEHQHLLDTSPSSSYELANDAAAMLLPLQFSDFFTGGGGFEKEG